MRKMAFAAALALVVVLPGAAMAGGHGVDHASKLHLSGVKLQFQFDQGHHRFFGAPKHRFYGRRPHFRGHRPHFRGHKRFVTPRHPGFRHGFVGRPDHRFKHLRRGFRGPKVWSYRPGHSGRFKPWRFERHGHGHLKHRGSKHRGFKHRGHRSWRR